MSQKQLAMYATICGAVVFIGTLLPWISVSAGPFSQTANAMGAGFDLGILVLLGGLATAAFAGLSWQGKSKLVPLPAKTQMLIAAAGMGLAVLFTLINFLKDFGPSVGGFGASRGIGMWVCLLASIAGAACMFLLLKKGGMLPKPDAGGDSDAPSGGGDDAPTS